MSELINKVYKALLEYGYSEEEAAQRAAQAEYAAGPTMEECVHYCRTIELAPPEEV